MCNRCPWAGDDPLYQHYHDHEWGVPQFDDNRLFELLILEGAQAGLSWITILRKRENYRTALDGFDAHKIAQYDGEKLAELMQNAGIVRNRLKIQSLVLNAQGTLAIQQEFGSFAKFIWQFVGDKPIQNHWQNLSQVPSRTPESDALSLALKKRGFKFIGTTICYAFMQATGMVNDHVDGCFRQDECAAQNATIATRASVND
ncbi:MAG: DNA-3-methyladenine glycosylase I [Gallionella sp.]|nr:DNA-3-methyladenine glycosylase I [Gallionella sp.]MDD4959046.1 DNA-3-methyladenine glycosylase I [Gallionella sp.]